MNYIESALKNLEMALIEEEMEFEQLFAGNVDCMDSSIMSFKISNIKQAISCLKQAR